MVSCSEECGKAASVATQQSQSCKAEIMANNIVTHVSYKLVAITLMLHIVGVIIMPVGMLESSDWGQSIIVFYFLPHLRLDPLILHA